MCRIFTDAGYHQGEYSWCFIVEDENEKHYGVFERTPETIQEAEFKTVFLALHYVYNKYKHKDIQLFIDNKQVVEYMQGHCRLRGLFHVQKEIFRLQFKNNINITYNHVHGHSGVKLNEMADTYARKALTRYFNESRQNTSVKQQRTKL